MIDPANLERDKLGISNEWRLSDERSVHGWPAVKQMSLFRIIFDLLAKLAFFSNNLFQMVRGNLENIAVIFNVYFFISCG